MQPTPPRRPLLTRRQTQILAGIARGHSNAQIGTDLGITTAGVHSHVQRICTRLGTSSRAGLVGHGYRTGILTGLAPEPRPQLTPLPDRLHQVLDAMARGLTNEQIGQELHLAEDTVKRYAQRLYDRLSATGGRPHAVALAYQHGLLTTTALQDAA